MPARSCDGQHALAPSTSIVDGSSKATGCLGEDQSTPSAGRFPPLKSEPTAASAFGIALMTALADAVRAADGSIDARTSCCFHSASRLHAGSGQLQWARLVSNQRPLACEASALPLSYGP